jgi:endonuclease III
MPILREILERLQGCYGRLEEPRRRDPFEMVLWENVAYLVDDAQREVAFRALRSRVGTKPADILGAQQKVLLEVAKLGGILAEHRVKKLLRAAEIAQEKFGGKVPAEKRALKLFPSIGEPGAEKILLFTKTAPVVALESNGLRVLVRLGYGREEKNYAATYRSVQEGVAGEVEEDCRWLIRMHQLLRRHGQEKCKRTAPRCGGCVVSEDCRYYQGRGR